MRSESTQIPTHMLLSHRRRYSTGDGERQSNLFRNEYRLMGRNKYAVVLLLNSNRAAPTIPTHSFAILKRCCICCSAYSTSQIDTTTKCGANDECCCCCYGLIVPKHGHERNASSGHSLRTLVAVCVW